MSDYKINFPGHGNLNVIELGKLPTADLVKLYNAKAPKPITSTPTKGKFVARVWDIYATLAKPAQPKPAEPAAAKAPKADKPKKPKAERPGRAREQLNFAAKPADERKQANSGSRMETLLVMASRKNGVTEQELKDACKAKDRFRAMVRWANEGLGWGFKEIADGRVVIVDGNNQPIEYTPRARDAE